MLGEIATFGKTDVDEHCEARSLGVGTDASYDVVDVVFAHFQARHRGKGVACACKKHAQIIIYFGGGADSASRIAGVDFLLHGNSGRKPFNVVAFRFRHSAEKLAGVSRERLDIAALSFGIECVESERRFSRAAHTCDHDEAVERQVKVDILEIVDSCPFYADFPIIYACFPIILIHYLIHSKFRSNPVGYLREKVIHALKT